MRRFSPLAVAALYRGRWQATASTPARHQASAPAAGNDDDLLPPLTHDDFDEFAVDSLAHTRDPDEQSPFELENEGLEVTVDNMLDELLAVRTDALHAFARTKGVRSSSKSGTVQALLEKARKEAHQPPQLRMTKRVLGEGTAELLPKSGIRTGWSNSSLEATMLEHACARLASDSNSNYASTVRSYSKRSAWISQRLLRMYQDDFKGTANAAVAGVFRSYKHEAETLVSNRKPQAILSAFASFLSARVSMAETSNLVTVNDIASKLIDQGVVRPTAEDEGLSLLESMVEMLDDVAAEVDGRYDFFKGVSQQQHFKDRPETLRLHLQTVKRRHASWDLEGAPQWATTFVAQFAKWEALVRNDVAELRSVPASFFEAILLNISAARALSMLHEKDDVSMAKDIPMGYRSLVNYELMQHFGNEDDVHDALLKLNHYVRADRAERARVAAPLFDAIVLQMQATLPDSAFRPPSQRLAIVLSEFALTASRNEQLGGLYRLLVNLTEDMAFHIRFTPIFDRMSATERQRLRLGRTNMIRTLEYFEQHMQLERVSTKCVAFLVTILLYFALRPSGSISPVLTRLASCTGRDDLAIIAFAERERDRVKELRVAYPPQLSHESWLQSDQGKGGSLYKVVPSHAVKSSTSTIMLISQAPIIRSLDSISRVPWRVNKYMLHVQEAMLQEGYGFGKIRPGFYPLNYCRSRDGQVDSRIDFEGNEENIFNERDARAYDETLEKDWRDLQDTRSSRVHYLQALRQARALVNEQQVFFPNNMDFRGRMYPLPGRLNHTGSDPFRALLENAIPKPLGHEGLYWLKVHVANKIGHTKVSFDDRAKFVDDHLNDVFQSAEAPLKGDRWWQDADEPMQCLMACKELYDAYQWSEGPHNFPSRLPVAVDGSYNGLQHYSAIGRDEHGAKLVNLIPSDKPADAYTGILREMMKSIVADAANDNEVAIRCLGSGRGLDRNHIRRKTIKRPIMTQVYGVTQYGMGKQIEDELIKQNLQHGLWLPAEMREMSRYIREKIMESLGTIFSQTQKCRQWLSEVGRLVWSCQPRDLKTPFTWTTPLGLIVRQPYRASSETNLYTTVGFTRISGALLEPASNKQLSALAPNLIHSLDATHLAMTALEMQNQGRSMMAVHDSYWTHACDLPTLSRVLREQFVDLYTHYDPLTELKEQWEEQYFMDLRRHGVRLPDPPQRGALDLQEVLKSDYFFS